MVTIQTASSLPPSGKYVRIFNHAHTTLVCDSVEVAGTFVSRFIGLLGRQSLLPNHGLWLCPSTGVHTLGMKFPIDVVALANDMTIVGLHPHLQPWRVARIHRKTSTVLELPAGGINAAQLAVGDKLSAEPHQAV